MTATRTGWHAYGPATDATQKALLARLRVPAVTQVTAPLRPGETTSAAGLVVCSRPPDFVISDQYPVIIFLFPVRRDVVPLRLWPRAMFLCQLAPSRVFACPFVEGWKNLSPAAREVLLRTQATRLVWSRFHMLASRIVLEQRFSRYLDFVTLQTTGTVESSVSVPCEYKWLPRHPGLVDAFRALDVDFSSVVAWLRRCLATVDPTGPWTLLGEGGDSTELAGYFPSCERHPESQTALFAERHPKSLKVPNRTLTIFDLWGTFRWRLPHVRVIRLSQLPKPEAAGKET